MHPSIFYGCTITNLASVSLTYSVCILFMIKSRFTQDNSVFNRIKLSFFTTKRCGSQYDRAVLVVYNVRHPCLSLLIFLPGMGSFQVHHIASTPATVSTIQSTTKRKRKEEGMPSL